MVDGTAISLFELTIVDFLGWSDEELAYTSKCLVITDPDRYSIMCNIVNIEEFDYPDIIAPLILSDATTT